MEPETIKAFVEGLTDHKENIVPIDPEVWEEVDGGAHFIVSRPRIAAPGIGELATIALTVSGAPNERARIIDEFITVLGEPAEKEVDLESATSFDSILWLVGVY